MLKPAKSIIFGGSSSYLNIQNSLWTQLRAPSFPMSFMLQQSLEDSLKYSAPAVRPEMPFCTWKLVQYLYELWEHSARTSKQDGNKRADEATALGLYQLKN